MNMSHMWRGVGGEKGAAYYVRDTVLHMLFFFGLVEVWWLDMVQKTHRMYLKYLGKLQERVPHTWTRKKFYINVCPWTVSEVQHNTLPCQSFRFLILETFEHPSVFSSNWNKTHFSFMSSHSQKMQQSMIRCVHVCTDSGAGHFENLLWIGKWWKIRILLTLNKLGMCTAHILCKL